MSLDQTPEDRMGVATRTGETFSLVFERRIAKPIDKVWAAITVPERIADWFAIVDIDPRLGGHYRIRFSPDDTPIAGEIVEWDPPRRLAHTWPDDDHAPATIRYELEPDGEGCVLRFSQTGVPVIWIDSVAGWHLFLDAIPGAVDHVKFNWTKEVETALMDLYRPRLTAAGF